MAGLKKKLRDAVSRIPPNLRRGNARRRCGTCSHFSGGRNGECHKYGVRVRNSELCDAFEPKGAR
jgi:hypothetical protein